MTEAKRSPPSLRRLLTGLLLGALLTLGLSSGLVGYLDALKEANELFDAKLAHSARVVEAIADRELMNPALLAPIVVDVSSAASLVETESEYAHSEGHAYETRLSFQAWSADGRLLLRSGNAPEWPIASLRPGFDDVSIDGRPWRVFTLRDPHGEWYQSGEDQAIRQELAREIAIGTVLPWLLALPLMGITVWLIVSWGLGPLQRLATQVRHRDPRQLAPLRIDTVPREVQALVSALNDLLARLDRALDAERNFTSDAAHELRTPLAALALHAENVATADNEADRQRSLADLRLSVRRSQRLIDQLLALARLDSRLQPAGSAESEPAAIALDALLARVLADYGERADQCGVMLELERGECRAWVRAEPLALEILFGNLIDNALRYGYQGGLVRIELRREGGGEDGRTEWCVAIEDAGPGIAVAERERLFERFQRGHGQSASGSGLGLSIARRIVEMQGGRIALGEGREGRGLRVQVWLPLGEG